jgi:hypothetical protein
MLDNNTYQLYSYNDGVPSGQAKDHQFVSNVLGKLGLGFDGDIDKHPTADHWGNPNSTIPGFSTVDGPPQAGDILATQKPIQTDWYYGGGQQMGIATGKDSSVGIINNMRIGESDFGLKDGHEPTIWRADAVANMGSPVSNAGQDPGLCQPGQTGPQQYIDVDTADILDRIGGVAGGAAGLAGGLPSIIAGTLLGGYGGKGIGTLIGPIKIPKPCYTGKEDPPLYP